MSKLNKQHLIKSLSRNEGYKQTAAYIRQLQKQDQAFFKMISNTLLQIFLSKTIHLLAKINALRLFRDIFISGQMYCIQQLDDKIEQYIFKLALYKKQQKDLNRGATYFIENQKRSDTQQIKKYGIVFHTLALQIIYCFGNWYPKDMDDQNSRFSTYLNQAIKLKVTFPQMKDFKYLKESDKSKFLKNYELWLKKIDEQDEQIEQPPKNEDKNKKSINSNINNIQQKKEVNKQSQKKEQQQKQQIEKFSKIDKEKKQQTIEKIKKQFQEKQRGYLLKLTQKQNVQTKLTQKIKRLEQQIQAIRNKQQQSNHKTQIYQLKTQLNNKQLQLNLYEEKFKKQKQQIQKHDQIQKQYKNQIIMLKNQLEKLLKQKQANNFNLIQKKNKQKQSQQAQQTLKKNDKEQEQLLTHNNSVKPIRSNKLSKTQQRSLDKKNNKLLSNYSISKKLQFNYQNQIFNFSNNTKNKSYMLKDINNISNTFESQKNFSNRNNKNNLSITMGMGKQRSPSRKSIFGLKDLVGTQLKFNEKQFDPINMAMLQFRKSCYSNGQIFYSNRYIQIQIEQFFGEKVFKLILTNISDISIKIQWNIISNKNYYLPKSQFNSNILLKPDESQQQFIQIQINSLNFKFIETSLKINREKNISLFLPITILNFIRFRKYNIDFERESNYQMIKSQQILIQRNFLGIQKYFQSYLIIDSNERFQVNVMVEYEFNNQIYVGLKIRGFKNKCVVQLAYDKNSGINQNFSKVLLQHIIFCFKYI